MTSILIAGGYGLVGSALARHIRKAHPEVGLVLAGRNPERGEALAAELGRARTARLDLAAIDLSEIGAVDLIVAALYDPANALLQAALARGAGYIGITIKAEDVAPIAFAAQGATPPVVMLGYAAAGAAALAARKALQAFARVDSIAITALFDMADPVGPATAGDAEALVARALLREHGVWRWVEGPHHPRAVRLTEGEEVYGLPTSLLDVPGLAAVSNAPNVRLDMAQAESRGTRRGRQASSDTYIDIAGVLAPGARGRTRIIVSGPRGLMDLTALGTFLAVERVLGLDSQPPARGGLHTAETLFSADAALARLAEAGVEIISEAVPYATEPPQLARCA